MADDKPIIVIKKKGGHGGAHGGAWKIAYADFVTAMMAFFMVMWLLNAAEVHTRKAIASYFRRPGIFAAGSGTPLEIGANGILPDGVPPASRKGEIEPDGTHEEPPKRKEKIASNELAELIDLKIKELKEIVKKLSNVPEQEAEKTIEQLEIIEKEKKDLQKVGEQIKEQIGSSPELKELIGAVDVKVDADGLNIEIMDTEKSSMFALGSASVMPDAEEAFKKLGTILTSMPNSIDIVGHTDAKPYRNRTGSYTNWELSSDRANTARRLLEEFGIAPERIRSVVGRADQELKFPDKPEDASNRRITLKMRYNLNRSVNIAKDPDILKSFDKIETKWQAQQAAAPKDKNTEPVHSFTVQDIIQEAEKRHEEIRLRRQVVEEPTPDPNKKDKIFGDSPLIGDMKFFDQ